MRLITGEDFITYLFYLFLFLSFVSDVCLFVGPSFSMYLWLSSNSSVDQANLNTICLCFQSARIKGMCYHHLARGRSL